jgi:hypothetical protein
MPGLVPGIHEQEDVDRRDKPGDDEGIWKHRMLKTQSQGLMAES